MPKIKTASSDPQRGTFSFFDSMDAESQVKWLMAGRKAKGNDNWTPETIIEIESEKEIRHIMGELPKGKQACVGGVR